MCLFSLRVQTVSPPRSPLAPASPTSITVSFSSWQPVWLCLLFFSLSLWSKSEILKKKKKRKNTSPSKCIWQIHCKLWIRFFFSADAEILMCQTFHAGKRVCCLFSQELQCDFTTVPSDGAHTKPAFKHNNIFSFYLYLVYTSAPHSLSFSIQLFLVLQSRQLCGAVHGADCIDRPYPVSVDRVYWFYNNFVKLLRHSILVFA